MNERDLLDEARTRLGVRRLLLALHGTSFPSDPGEDVGVGAPGTAAGMRLLALTRALGFTGVQLGPGGETSRENPSPYDSAIFSRALTSIPLAAFGSAGAFAGLVGPESLAGAIVEPTARARHRAAFDTMHGLVAQAYRTVEASPRAADLPRRLAVFSAANAEWLERDGLYAALHEAHGSAPPRAWPDARDATLFAPAQGAAAEHARRRGELAHLHERALRVHAFGQLIAHAEHERVRAAAHDLGLSLYADLQVGFSPGDVWSRASAFLPGYFLGAPPSRTNPAGQAWHYPVLDPRLRGSGDDEALALVVARAEHVFAQYDGVRIDHPHGLVCPWVYRDTPDPGEAVRAGARLFESPDLADHPLLAAFAIADPNQLDRSVPRYADDAVGGLTTAQIDRYAVFFDALLAAAARHGRSRSDVSCEVLSTLPAPLRAVLARHQLGRWRVAQKANLDDPGDVYRTENAAPADWVMIGNHDTPSLFGLHRAWDASRRTRWAAHLVARLGRAPSAIGAVAESPGLVATLMLAELLACPAEHVMVFFPDLFGIAERFNVPGTVSHDNWTLRLSPGFAHEYAERLARGEALDVPLAMALALEAREGRGVTSLSARLWERAGGAAGRLQAAEA